MDRDVWNSLVQFQTIDLVKREYQRIHGRELSEKQTWQIVSCFVQGQEYFLNASRAAESVRPLLLYYGVLALSRGIILFRDRSKNEDSLIPGHGLRPKDWTNTLANGTADVLSLEAETTSGTFSELFEATRKEVVPLGSIDRSVGFWNIERHLGESAPGIVKLDDILSRTPRLTSIYHDVTQKRTMTCPGVVEANESAAFIRILIDPVVGVKDVEEVRMLFQVSRDIEIGAYPASDIFMFAQFNYRLPHEGGSISSRCPGMEGGWQKDGFNFLIAPWSNGGYISPLLRGFLMAYFLGMLARYYPSRWMALIGAKKGDAAMPLLRAAIGHVEDSFPQLAIDTLINARLSY